MAEGTAIVTKEQLAYARVLDIGMKIGLLGIIITFAAYTSGAVSSHVPRDEISRYWGLSVHDYLAATGIEPGWWWLSMLGKGDFLNFAPIAFLAGVTIFCYLSILPALIKNKDNAYAVIAIVEVLVLSLAASGLLTVGGH